MKAYSSHEEVLARLQELTREEQEFFMSHIYLYDGYINEIIDDGMRWNHSESPNTGQCVEDLESSYAIRDILEGEELLDDYGVYEYPSWFEKLMQDYSIPHDFITKKDPTKPGFHVKYEIKKSTEGRGNGLFATQFIPKDALIWKFVAGVNVKKYTEDEVLENLRALDDPAKEAFFLSHIYLYGGYANEILDDGCMWNHSDDPNTCSGYLDDWDSTYAARDIEPGEELLDDYGTYDYPQWFLDLCTKCGVKQDFFIVKENVQNPKT